MMLPFIVAAALLAAPKTAVNSPPPLDLRTFCNAGAKITQQESKKGTGGTILRFTSNKQRMIRLSSGQVLLAQQANGKDELLVEEDGRYRRLVSSSSNIEFISESPDHKWIAVVVSHEKETKALGPVYSALYVFSQSDFVGDEALHAFGFSGIAWSPDSSRIAVGDFSKIRIYDLAAKKNMLTCGVDSITTEDGKEQVQELGWIDAKSVRFRYQNPVVKLDYKVNIP